MRMPEIEIGKTFVSKETELQAAKVYCVLIIYTLKQRNLARIRLACFSRVLPAFRIHEILFYRSAFEYT